jgi:hypothetical protein
MTKTWTREDTQLWVAQLENRIEDIDYYLTRAVEWCENHNVYNDQAVFACCAMTVIWVSHMRNESITQKEMFEMMGIEGWELGSEIEYRLGEIYNHMDHEDLLELVTSKW